MKSKTINVVKSSPTMVDGAATAQDSNHLIFPMVILQGLAVLIRVRRLSLKEETTNLLMYHPIYYGWTPSYYDY
jgi:hypothetical protein